MIRTTLPLAIALSLSLAACQRAEQPASVATVDPEVAPAAPVTPTDEAAQALAASADTNETGGSFAGGISADAITAAAEGASYSAADGPNLDALKAAVDRVQQSNERMRQIEASKPRTGAAPASPAPSAPSTPAAPQGLPPVQFRLTGDSIVPKAPELATDVMRGMQRVFATQTGCTAIGGIDTRAVSAQGPFDKNAQGRLVSGTIVERWTVSGCGKTAAYHLVLSVRPDSTVDYAITAA